jgi:type I restriction enzyme S subunit
MSAAVKIEPLSSDKTMSLPPLPKGWEWQRFADHCDRVSVGHVGPTSEFFCPRSEGVILIRSQDVRPGRLMHETAAAVTPAFHAKLKKSKLQPGDILFVRVGANRGDCCVVPTGIEELNCANIVFARPKVKNGFFGFYFRSPLGQSHLLAATTGAAQGVINTGSVAEMPVPVPPLPVQRRIAGILSAYDELIENSQRRIRLLEDMARALYREWFVHFRFPRDPSEALAKEGSDPLVALAKEDGHDSVPRLPSALGNIPHGWEVSKLADFVTTKYGYTESTNVEPVGPKYLRGMDINKTSYIDWSEVPYCPISPEDNEAYRLRVGDVVVIRMADPGKVGIVEQEVDAVFASYLIRVAPKDSRLSPYFLFYLMESTEYYAFITGASTGTTRKSASAGVIAEYQFVLPPQKLVEEFERRVGEIRSLLTTLLKKTVNLRRTRDLLLPRLLPGQVAVDGVAN